jgi:thiol-disulfide isomerase/thioredoxin
MTTDAPRQFPLVPVIFGVVAIALIAVVVLTFENGGGESDNEIGSPEVTGEFLTRLPDAGGDPAVGSPIPEVVGADFEGNEVSITDDGNAKIIIFLAHWCPFCQQELPEVSEWLEDDPLPEGVSIYAVATATSSTRENYPPSAWFDREGWSGPIITDDAASRIGQAFGLPAYPYWVFTDADNNVLARVTGGVPRGDLDNAVATLAATVQG